jgi:formylglycine-generating enzyme required for sulfatase activity
MRTLVSHKTRTHVAVIATALCVAGLSHRAEPAPRQTAASPAAAYVETIPGTSISFDMVLIPSGSFMIGSPASEAGRSPDEGPQQQVRIQPFWMGRTEITWDEYDAFAFAQAIAAARAGTTAAAPTGADAITRPTPPYADESFGYGKGRQPVISIQ